MLIIADQRIPTPAKTTLEKFGELHLLKTTGVTYEAISGHPDVFLCSVNDQLVIAPNICQSFKDLFHQKKINYAIGELPIGGKYPATATYNIVCTEKFLLHNFRYTDSVITNLSDDLQLIHLNQGYSRCNLIPLKNDHFITSDEGIHRVLNNYKLDTLLVNPAGILLPGFDHGFIGGTAGVIGSKIFFLGKLDLFPDGRKIRQYLSQLDYQIIELYDGPLFDGGSIFFID